MLDPGQLKSPVCREAAGVVHIPPDLLGGQSHLGVAHVESVSIHNARRPPPCTDRMRPHAGTFGRNDELPATLRGGALTLPMSAYSVDRHHVRIDDERGRTLKDGQSIQGPRRIP